MGQKHHLTTDQVIETGRRNIRLVLAEGREIFRSFDMRHRETYGSFRVSRLLNYLKIEDYELDRRSLINELIPHLLFARTSREISLDPGGRGLSAAMLLWYFLYRIRLGDELGKSLRAKPGLSDARRLQGYYKLMTQDLEIHQRSAGGYLLGVDEESGREPCEESDDSEGDDGF